MAEIGNMVARLRELGVQAASDTVGPNERVYLDREVQQLKLEMERIARSTEFNGMHLLRGEGEKLDFQIGVNNDAFLDRISYDPQLTNVTLAQLGLDQIDVSQKEGAQNSLAKLDDSIRILNSNRSQLGALQSRLNSTINNTEVAVENFSAAKSRIRDADVAKETAEFARTNILQQAGISVLAQANQSQAMMLKLLG